MSARKLIKGDYIIRADYQNLPSNLVGVGIYVDKQNQIVHSGIFIRYNSENYFFHYDSTKVELIKAPEKINCFFKHLPIIPPELVPSFYNYFRIVEKKAKPEYGYFYTGSFYDQATGGFKDHNSLPEYMSCVGFCLNILKTCLRGQDFMKYQDWDFHDGTTPDQVLVNISNIHNSFPHIPILEIVKNIRRILPLEYFTSGFGSSIPVDKAFTDKYSGEVHSAVISKIT